MPATQPVRGQTRPRRHLLHLLPPTETRLPFCEGDRQRQETGVVALRGARSDDKISNARGEEPDSELP